ncbi:MAG: hypothetical protein M0Z53_14050 [Thermaerobacter sp.]|nr:hypothetical protein [Thermaerobacter sp.]
MNRPYQEKAGASEFLAVRPYRGVRGLFATLIEHGDAAGFPPAPVVRGRMTHGAD